MKLTQRKAVLVVMILVVVACSFAVYLKLFTGKELWYEMFAAILGVIITAVITMILLKGQSDDDVERERAAKIFEEKLRIYQDYLHTLCDVIKDHRLSDEEKTRLEFQTSYVAMHCEPKYVATVSRAIKELIEETCPEDGEKQHRINKSDSPDPLLDKLFCIVEAFRKDLYGDDFKFDDNYKWDTLVNFSNAYLNAKSDDGDAEDELPCRDADLGFKTQDGTISDADQTFGMEGSVRHDEWEKALEDWRKSGWGVAGLSTPDDDRLLLKKIGDNDVRSARSVVIGFDQGHYYIKAQHGGDADFSRPLKWMKGGRRTYGSWWKYLPEPYYDIPQGKLAEAFDNDLSLREYIIKNVNELTDILDRHHRTFEWEEAVKKEVGQIDKWRFFIWYWDMLACEFDNLEEGKPYMDVIEKNGKVLIQFSNRQDDAGKLSITLKRIGCENRKREESGYVMLEEIPSTETKQVAEKVAYWVRKING